MQVRDAGWSGEPFRVIALISAYNEGDIISAVIQHLVENGVEVYLLDNRSTDDTVSEASRWLGRGLLEIESFPDEGDSRFVAAATEYDWTAILRRKEELARTLDGDWFLHHDADEIRESPWPGVSIKDAIHFVHRLDYNAIDFRVFEFPPVDNGFGRGCDLRSYFTHYRAAGEYDQLQVKGWKARSAPISLVHYGGHDVEFQGRRVFPIPFLLRHYPIRSQAHGRRKVFEERKNRFSAEERAKSWHRQYDHIHNEEHSFLVDPEFLRPFDLDRARLDVSLRHREAVEQENAMDAKLRELQAASDDLAGQARDLAAALAGRDRELDDLRLRASGLETELARTRVQLNSVYSSRTWRWGEPIGRFITTLGTMRKRS